MHKHLDKPPKFYPKLSRTELSSLKVLTSNGRTCDFSQWENHLLIPELHSSCTRNYYHERGGKVKNGYYPFCFWGPTFLDWDYCQSELSFVIYIVFFNFY